ncbi:MAG: TIGR03936 family radical SAM-associated protein [Oscillospiraceae bacterium]|nr:TIGR03936 family radical SAM-associated protein [Oscillospiraceae bacterium]
MTKTRLRMTKLGPAVYISHLDLMRTTRRAFTRADIALRHSEGFNPHPLMSFALPLSVGQESVCELLDFEAEGALPPDAAERLNDALPEGLRVLEIYAPEAKLSMIKYLEITGYLFYDEKDKKVSRETISLFNDYFAAEKLIISKKTKRGEGEIDIKPMISSISFSYYNSKQVSISAIISAQNPTLNPASIAAALPLKPDLAQFRRVQIFDSNLNVFR